MDPQPPSLSDPFAAVAEEVAIVSNDIHQPSSSRALQGSAENVMTVNHIFETAEEVATITDEFQEPPIFPELPAEVATTVGDDVHRPSPSCAWPTAEQEAAENAEAEERRRRFVLPNPQRSWHPKSTLSWIWSCVRDIFVWFHSIA